MNPPDCLFCKISEGKISACTVYEDAAAISFLDSAPRAPGHTLVIPRRHAGTLLELSDKEIGPFWSGVKKTAGMVLKGIEADGLTIGINQGRASGQAVQHLHVHILPRFSGDGGVSIHGVVENIPKESLTQIAGRIKSVRNP